MARGTFANIRIVNKFLKFPGPKTMHFPSKEEMDIFDCAERYMTENIPLILLVGKDYGSGSSRDWAAKGPYLQGIKAVIAESYERIHRSNLVGMGIIPLQYLEGQNAETLGLTGLETYDIILPSDVHALQKIEVVASTGTKFQVIVRFDTDVDVAYFKVNFYRNSCKNIFHCFFLSRMAEFWTIWSAKWLNKSMAEIDCLFSQNLKVSETGLNY